MLANLLPGIRELRAPIAAGYLWFVAGWVAFGEHLPQHRQAGGLIRRLYDLAAAAGVPTVTVALSFTAYLVGVLSESVTTYLLKRANPRRLRPGAGEERETVEPLSPQGERAVRAAVVDELEDRLADKGTRRRLQNTPGGKALLLLTSSAVPNSVAREALREQVSPEDLDAVAADLVLLPSRLLGREPDVYAAYDRQRAEAEFRAAVSIPLGAVVAALIVVHSPWWWWGMAFPVLLAFIAWRERRAAGNMLAAVVRARRSDNLSPAVLEVADRRLERPAPFTESIGDYPRAARAAVYVARSLRAKAAPDAGEWTRLAAEGAYADTELRCPEFPAAMYEYAGFLLEQGNEAERIRWLQNAAGKGSDEARFDLARHYLARGKIRWAAVSAQDVAPTSEPGRSAALLDLLYEIGVRAEEQGENELARGLYDAAVGQDLPPQLLELAPARAEHREAGGAAALDAVRRAQWEPSIKEADVWVWVNRTRDTAITAPAVELEGALTAEAARLTGRATSAGSGV